MSAAMADGSVQLLYFAWVREQIGNSSEFIALTAPEPAHTLLPRLRQRSAGHATALADPDRLRIALNQEHVGWDVLVSPGDELAIFPPVTGG